MTLWVVQGWICLNFFYFVFCRSHNNFKLDFKLILVFYGIGGDFIASDH